MFTPRSYAVHAPALSLPEAARLPAIERNTKPFNLVLPDRRMYYPMPDVTKGGRPVDNLRRGSMAGRAVLRMVTFPKGKGRA